MPAKAGVSAPSSISGSAKTDARSMGQATELPLIDSHLDIRPVARLPDPVLESLFGFALADRKLRLHALAVGGHVLLAPLQYFDQMPAEGRAHRGRYLVEGELAQRFFERGHHIAGIDP